MKKSRPSELRRIAEARQLYRDGTAAEIREQARVSQAEFARGVGASRAAVCLWEAGLRQPSAGLAVRALALLKALGLPDERRKQ
ncbi:helix-turn-helix domain-containing protein [Leifsonia naganoensis]|uniref:DNA-binding transcriptional regulator YiaG n=1 Tax=Leifsonia naganoensis TaxID=150025 RepID=A0A853DLW6_9MICO|nr:helix-turn-helix domain-containing protein [Leifsonia naganoensis]NYK08583.1 DNA-binding transcriptional regulator YiaG [Leifsonia naganoensis]